MGLGQPQKNSQIFFNFIPDYGTFKCTVICFYTVILVEYVDVLSKQFTFIVEDVFGTEVFGIYVDFTKGPRVFEEIKELLTGFEIGVLGARVCLCLCVSLCVCVCLCVCLHIYICMYVFMCVHACILWVAADLSLSVVMEVHNSNSVSSNRIH